NFTAMPVNGGTAPSYQWQVNGTNVGSGPSYTFAPVSSNTVTVMLTSNAACATVATVNDRVIMDTLPVFTPDVIISAAPGNSVCEGTAVTVTASPVNGGSAPAY